MPTNSTNNRSLSPSFDGPIRAEAPKAPEADASAAQDDPNTEGRRAVFLDREGRWREGTAVLLPATDDISAILRKFGYRRDTFVAGYRDSDPGLEMWSAEAPPAGNYLLDGQGALPRPLPCHLVRLCMPSRDYEVWIDRLSDALGQVEHWLSIIELMRRIRVLDAAGSYLDQGTN